MLGLLVLVWATSRAPCVPYPLWHTCRCNADNTKGHFLGAGGKVCSHVFLDHRAQYDRFVLRVSGRQGGRPQWKVYNAAYLASMARPEGHFILVRNAVRP